MKLAIIDIDGVLVDTTARFDVAHQAKIEILQKSIGANHDSIKEIAKRAEDEFWRVAFSPESLALDVMLPGVSESLQAIEADGYVFGFLSSRPESLREATMDYFWNRSLVVHGYMEDNLVLKPPAFQHVKTPIWKAGTVQMLANMNHLIQSVLFVDDEQANREAVIAHPALYKIQIAESLAAAVP